LVLFSLELYRGKALKGELQDNIGERIRRLRGRLGITQEQLAQSLGVTLASIRNWENGRSRPGKDVRGLIAAAESRGLEAILNGAAGSNGRNDAVWDIADVQAKPLIDFSADPEVVRTEAEGERLAYGYLFNPAFAGPTRGGAHRSPKRSEKSVSACR
jgi:transcriptional regulator with XRE-family HTH domain